MWLIGAILLLLSIKCGLPNVLTSNLTVLLLFKSLTTSSIISDSIFITNYANVFLVFICAAAFTGRTATFIWALICLTYYIYCFNFSTPNAELELLYDRLDYKPYYKFAYDLATIALPCFMYAIYTIFSNRIINKTKETRLKLEQNHQELTNQSKYLLATKAELEDSNQKLERYAHMVSHDMKQPIRTITSFTQLLSKRLTQLNLQDEKATEYINFIVQGTKGMDSLIQEILNYSMKTTDQSGSSVKAQESLDIALSNLSALINDNEIELEVGALPTVNITSSHLVQIFQNLISNAIKYKKPHIPLSLKITVFEKTKL